MAAEWVHGTVATEAVQVLQQLSNHAALPTLGSSPGAWCYFAVSILTAPMMLLFIGALVAVFESPLSSCCQPRRSVAAPSASKAAFRRLLAVWALALAVLGAGATIACIEGFASYKMFASDVHRSLDDLHRADYLASSINETGTLALGSIAGLVQSCPKDAQPFMEEAIKSPLHTGRKYLKLAADYSAIISKLPARAQVVQSYLELTGSAILALTVLPFLLVFAALLAVGFVAFVSLRQSKGIRGRRPSRLASCCVALIPSVVLCVSGFAAMNLLVASSAAAVCVAPSTTLLSYPGHSLGFKSTAYNVTSYYLEGRDDLKASASLAKASVLLSELVGHLEEYSQDLKQLCDGWDAAVSALKPQLQSLQDSVAQCQLLISPKNIYPYWEVTIHENLCGAATWSMSIAVLAQVILAFFCLPLVAAVAKNLLAHLGAEAQSRELALEQRWAWKTKSSQDLEEGVSEVVLGRPLPSSPVAVRAQDDLPVIPSVIEAERSI